MLQEHACQELHGVYHERRQHFHLQPAEHDKKSRHIAYQASWHNGLKFTTLASENPTSSNRRQPIYDLSREEGFDKSWPKMKPKKVKGEVIDGHGGRIVRSSGRKDRHSKVCTTRGPRDRRVRLSPNTAIQFYDVQDRLGYDRPSKAIDWLLKEAKAAIDALEDSAQASNIDDAVYMNSNVHHNSPTGFQDHSHQVSDFSNTKCAFQNHEQMNEPTSHMSFFSMVNGATPSSSRDIQPLSGSFQALQNGSVLFPGDSNGTFPNSTSSHSQINPVTAPFQRFFSWDANEKRNDLELLINSLPLEFPGSALSQNHVFHQREPLQSTLCPIRASSTMQFSNINVSYSSFGFANDGSISVLGEQNPVSGRPSSASSLLQD